jgi:hypothetical protein
MAKGLCKDVDERFQPAVEMLDVLEKAMIRMCYTLYDCMIRYSVQSEAKFVATRRELSKIEVKTVRRCRTAQTHRLPLRWAGLLRGRLINRCFRFAPSFRVSSSRFGSTV